MEKEKERMEERLKRGEHFRNRAAEFIKKVSELHKEVQDKTRDDISVLMDEILHSIFFLGKIHDPPVPPELIMDDEVLKSRYRQSYELCSSQLPTRSPFSCVLDMVIHLLGQGNLEKIREKLISSLMEHHPPEVEDGVPPLQEERHPPLQEEHHPPLPPEVEDGVPSKRSRKNDKKKKKDFISTAICVSQKSNDSVRHYGVSMSTSGSNAGKIMIAASCLSAWDDYVAGAVMTYYPEKFKKPYFDGTIKIPHYVRCQTFRLENGEEMNPCKSCSNMFGLNTDETKEWPYGNCAEAESLSKLLKNEKEEVKKQFLLRSDMWTPENINRVREDVREKLDDVLDNVKFRWDGKFYTPQ